MNGHDAHDKTMDYTERERAAVARTRSLLSNAGAGAADQALRDESEQRTHMVVYLSGAHAYGFPSPDSDLDLKAVHIAPTRSLVGLDPPKLSADRFEVLDGVEIDYTSNELGPVLAGVIGGNGNYVERVLGDTCLADSPELHQLRPLVRAVLSCKLYRHYAGFARNQFSLAFEAEDVAIKKVLYVLRTALTGTHVLRTGDVVTDVNQLLDEYDLAHARELIERKRVGERVMLEQASAERWRADLVRVLDNLDHARDHALLPLEPENTEPLTAWLLAVRKKHW